MPALRRLLYRRLDPASFVSRTSSAVVFAPHQDDECLGCGGTVISKREAGASVRIVFMTDGSGSHPQFIPPERLAGLRAIEAVDAARVLGVDESDIVALGFPDGQLAEFHQDAVVRVVSLLNQYQPDEVFVPCRGDGLADHEATYRVVIDAIASSGCGLRVYEYPIWLWNTWPWVSVDVKPDSASAKRLLQDLRRTRLGADWLPFRSAMFVRDVLPRKEEALAQHRSQMSRLNGQADWPTLADVSDGDFLACFFQDYEIFRRTDYP